MKVKIAHLPAYMAAITVVIVSAMMWSYHNDRVEKDLFHQESSRALFHLKADQMKIEHLLNSRDYAAVQSMLPTLSESSFIKRILLIDVNYKVMAASEGKLHQTDVSDLSPDLQKRLSRYEVSGTLNGVDVATEHELIYPLSLYGQIQGFLYIQLNKDKLDAINMEAFTVNISIFISCALALAVIFYQVSRQMMHKRLNRLVRVLVEYTDGDRETRFAARDSSEFQQLELLLNGTLDLLQHEQQVIEQERLFSKQVLDSMTDGVITIDQSGEIVMLNTQAVAMFGYNFEEELLGSNVLTLIPSQFQAKHMDGLIRANAEFTAKIGVVRRVEQVAGLKRNGTEFPISVTITKNRHEEGLFYSAFIRDLTEQHQYQQSLAKLAYHDSITGLFNALGFKNQIANLRQPMNLCLLELNELHSVNETFGYDIGDRYLLDFSERLQQLPLNDLTLAKGTGARFMVATSEPQVELQKELAGLLNKSVLVVDVAKRVEFYGAFAHVASMGQLDDQLRYCRIAIKKALEQAADHFVEVDVQWIEDQLSRSKIQHKLSVALNNQELYFEFQPKYDCKTRKLVSAEALIRWRSDGEIISPSEFIPIAEKCHLMPQMDRYVISSACKFIRRGLEHGLSLVPISINLSSRYLFLESTIAYIFEKIGEYKVPARLIEIEVTEYELIENFDTTATNMERLQNAGIKVAIDDYGIGHSNLETVSSLPIQHLKIDQSFIKRALGSNKSRAILENILDLAQSLEIEITAEGVETEEQLAYVSSLGCDFAQGYLLSKPLNQRDFESLLTK